MKFKSFLFPVMAVSLLASCQNEGSSASTTADQQDTSATMVNDPHTYAQPEKAKVTHLYWDAEVSFEKKQINATAIWDVENTEGTEEVIFDTYGLDIKHVLVNGDTAEYQLGEFKEDLGQPLTIKIDGSKDAQEVSIAYSTTDKARALQWLDAEQTADEKSPFLFTQSQAILARSWVPTQDSPGIRFTYSAKVKVPENMMALMSASNPTQLNDNGVYTFKMPQPIPAYLLALSVGEVEYEKISERTGVYAEPSLLDTAAYEFADLEKMVQAAEKLYGPYAWGQYDIIVLPPSFPFGGMENPRLTFATPTILAGDRSLVSLVAHELAHSWSGNLVTNATWNDFWLNEGFTVYFEHRIMEEVYGRGYSEMLASLTRAGLQEDAKEMMKEMPEDTRLKLELEGRNPDEGVTSIPYDKGYFFLRLIEETVGRERFDEFLKNYFETNKFKVMTTEEFVDYLNANLLSDAQMDSVRVEEWIYQQGIPDNLPEVKSEQFAVVDLALDKFLDENTIPQVEITNKWTTHEWLHFINSLPENISSQQLAQLDEAYNFSQSGNSEILAAWFQPTIRNNYEPVYSKVEEFLIKVGRRKFLTPTYRAMIESGKKEMALDIYQEARPNYHAVSRETIDDLLGYQPEQA